MYEPLEDILQDAVLSFHSVGPEDGIQVSGLVTSGFAHCIITKPFRWPSFPDFQVEYNIGLLDNCSVSHI